MTDTDLAPIIPIRPAVASPRAVDGFASNLRLLRAVVDDFLEGRADANTTASEVTGLALVIAQTHLRGDLVGVGA